MIIYDLTYVIKPDMPVYPGTEGPLVKQANTLQEHGFAETLLTLYSHTGTHMDAPAHMIEDGKTLDQFPVETFMGQGFCIDVSEYSGTVIPLEMLRKHEAQLEQCQWVLFCSGWSQYWGTEAYYKSFPILSSESAHWIADLGLKGVGIDAISFDSMDSTAFENHSALLRKGMLLVENLKDMAPLINKDFKFCCLPMLFDNADGAPVRAVALV